MFGLSSWIVGFPEKLLILMVTMEFLKLLKYWLCYKIDDNVLLINFVLPLAASAPAVLNVHFLICLNARLKNTMIAVLKAPPIFSLP